MKKLFAIILTLVIALTPLLSLTTLAFEEDVIFEGDFKVLTLVVGEGSDDDVYKGIKAKDAETDEDLTSQIKYVGEIDFDTVGSYDIRYIISGKGSVKDREVRIVESSSKGDLVRRELDHGRNYFQSPDFASVYGTSRDLIYEIYDSKDESGNLKTLKYSWTIKGENIKSDYPKRFDVNISNDCSNAEAIKKAVGKVDYKIISFNCGNVDFPAPSSLLLLVGDVFKNGDSLYLYKYADEKLTLVADSITVNGRHITYTLSRGGDYVLTNKKAGYQEPVSSAETSSAQSSSVQTSSATSSATSSVTSSEPTSSDETSAIGPTLPSTPGVTSSELTPTSSQEENTGTNVGTVLLVIVLSAIALMTITIIAFITVKNISK